MHRSALLARPKREPTPAVLLKKSSKYDGVLSTLDTGASSTKARPKPGGFLRLSGMCCFAGLGSDVQC